MFTIVSRDESRRGRCVSDIKTARMMSHQNSSTSPDESLLVLVQCRSVLITIGSCSVLNQPSPYRLSWPRAGRFLPPSRSSPLSVASFGFIHHADRLFDPLRPPVTSQDGGSFHPSASFLFSASLSSPVSSFLSSSLLIHSPCSSKLNIVS